MMNSRHTWLTIVYTINLESLMMKDQTNLLDQMHLYLKDFVFIDQNKVEWMMILWILEMKKKEMKEKKKEKMEKNKEKMKCLKA